METCAEAFHVADASMELGHEVRVVPAMLVRSLGVGARGVRRTSATLEDHEERLAALERRTG